MFWGVTISTNKSYREIVKIPFHVSMASLALQSEKESMKDKKYVSLMLRYNRKEFVLCTLEYGKVMYAPLDLVFDKGEQVEFFIMGHGNIHLSGFKILEYDENTSGDYTVDSECYESSSTEELTSESEEIESSTDLNSDDSPKQMRENRALTKCRKLVLKSDCLKEEKKKEKIMKNKIPAKKGKLYSSYSGLDSNESELNHKEIKMESSKKKCVNGKRKSSSEVNLNNISENGIIGENLVSKMKSPVSSEKERLSKSNVVEEKGSSVISASSEIKSPKSTQSMKNTKRKSIAAIKQLSCTPTIKKNRKSAGNATNLLDNLPQGSKEMGLKMQNGVEIKDMKVGNGPAARKGKLVHLCYVGYLDNGEEFSSMRNRPFSFRLGNADDVVKGLSSGIEGMKVGGKRKIIIPPSEGFGNKTVGSVPPNSTVTYEVELKAVS